tara:strand:+ start:146 stop:490 length:345 start_codon:yes stop_codon:yes gene_type:complete
MQQIFETSRFGDVLRELYIEGFKYFNVEKYYEPMTKSYIIPRVQLYTNKFKTRKVKYTVPKKYTYAYVYPDWIPDDDRPVLDKKVWRVQFLEGKDTAKKSYVDIHNTKTWEANK